MLDTIFGAILESVLHPIHKEHHHSRLSHSLSRLAHCESTNNPRAVNPSRQYFGLYQFDLTTWHSLGYRGNPIHASAAVQTRAAVKLHNQRGWKPWPYCSRKLGLR